MLKIFDRTSHRKYLMQDCTFWDNENIKSFIEYKIHCYELYITDEIVDEFNNLYKSLKSDEAFVRHIRELNKKGYFQDLLERLD